MTTIVRASLAHTPRDPFVQEGALETIEDAGLAFAEGRIVSCGPFADVRQQFGDAELLDASDALLLPGFVDCHVHFPQVRVIGAVGLELLDWLRLRALPEEARLVDSSYAQKVAERFVGGLAANGTTTALVFGSHFPDAQEALFSAADAAGLRIASGLVVSDRNLLPELHTSAGEAIAASRALIERWHGHGLLRYAVTPRFALSCSEEMLEACGELAGGDVLVTTHINESRAEVEIVGEQFPWAGDYLAVYERYDLVRRGTVLAHNIWASDDELRRLAGAGTAVAHCPSSNRFLGSGSFPLRRHLDAGVRIALGTDVGAGTSLSVLGEGLAAYENQGSRLGAEHLLFLATRAGALALGLEDEVGDLSPGKSADFVLVRAPAGSTLEAVLEGSESIEERLGAVFTLAREESIAEVRVAGRVV